MRVAVRVGAAGRAVLLAVLLTGCGGAQAPPGAGPGPLGAASTAPGVDGEADPERVFTEGELKAALLPAEVLGRDAKVTRDGPGALRPTSGGDKETGIALAARATEGVRAELYGADGADGASG